MRFSLYFPHCRLDFGYAHRVTISIRFMLVQSSLRDRPISGPIDSRDVINLISPSFTSSPHNPCANVDELVLSSQLVTQTTTKRSSGCAESLQYSKASQPAAPSQTNYHLRSRIVSAILLTVAPMPVLSGSMKMPPAVGLSTEARKS